MEERALSRRHDCLDTAGVERHVVEAAGWRARECTISYSQCGASNVELEAHWKCPAPEACETAVLELARHASSSGGMHAWLPGPSTQTA